MEGYVILKLTESQAKELRELVRYARVKTAQNLLDSPRKEYFSQELAYYKRLETTLVKQLAKS